MVDTSYERFRYLHECLESDTSDLADRDQWNAVSEERRRNIIAHLSGMLNGRRTVLHPNDVPESTVTPW